MSQQSAVSFPGKRRVHVALGVEDLERSIAFYESMFGRPPSKVRPGYAKFEPEEPSLNLALNKHAGAVPMMFPAHFGIQVKSTEEVAEMTGRFEAAGLSTRTEENETCCYAVQDKVWVTDPDGNGWEVFAVLDEAEAYARDADGEEACCTNSECCTA